MQYIEFYFLGQGKGFNVKERLGNLSKEVNYTQEITPICILRIQ